MAWPLVIAALEVLNAKMVADDLKEGKYLDAAIGVVPWAKASKYTKSAWTIGKRIGGRNVRKVLLSEGYDLSSALGDTASSTAWITRRIVAGDVSKKVKNEFLVRTSLGRGINDSQAMNQVRRMKIIAQERKYKELNRLAEETAMRRQFPNLDMKTGEMLPNRNARLQAQDTMRWSKQAWMDPQSTIQRFVGGFARGGTHQFVGTNVFRFINTHTWANGPAWATQFVQNLDELVLPAASATSPFTRAELFVRLFDVATVRKSKQFGSYARVNRIELLRDLGGAINPKNSIRGGDFVRSYFTPEGVGRAAGSLTARSLMQRYGNEDWKQKEVYIKKAQAAQDNSSGGNSGTVHIRAHTRNGHHVKAYTRRVGDRS